MVSKFWKNLLTAYVFNKSDGDETIFFLLKHAFKIKTLHLVVLKNYQLLCRKCFNKEFWSLKIH